MIEALKPITLTEITQAVRHYFSNVGANPKYIVVDAESARAVYHNIHYMTMAPIAGDSVSDRWLIAGVEVVVIPADVPFVKVVGPAHRELWR